MFFAHIKNAMVGENGGGLYNEHAGGREAYFKDTFCPHTEIVSFISFHASGKTYAEKKESVRNAALDYQNAQGGYQFSYSEIITIGAWFERMGRKYGLMKEFRENAII